MKVLKRKKRELFNTFMKMMIPGGKALVAFKSPMKEREENLQWISAKYSGKRKSCSALADDAFHPASSKRKLNFFD